MHLSALFSLLPLLATPLLPCAAASLDLAHSTLADRARLQAAGHAASEVQRALVGLRREPVGTRKEVERRSASASAEAKARSLAGHAQERDTATLGHFRLGLAAHAVQDQDQMKRSPAGAQHDGRRLVRRHKALSADALALKKRQAQCPLQTSTGLSLTSSATTSATTSSSKSTSTTAASSVTTTKGHTTSTTQHKTSSTTVVAPTTSSTVKPTTSVTTTSTQQASASGSASASASASASGSASAAAADPFGPGPYSGWATYYDVGLSACGTWDTPSMPIVAVSAELFDQWPGAGPNPNLNPICGRHLEIQWGGKSLVAEVTDRCPGCAVRSLDLSLGAFEHFAFTSVGLLGMDTYTGNITWSWVEGTGRLPEIPVNADGNMTT